MVQTTQWRKPYSCLVRCCTGCIVWKHPSSGSGQLTAGYVVQGHLQFFMKEHDEAMKTYEQGLSYDKDNSELREGLMRCQQAINKVHLLSPPGWQRLSCHVACLFGLAPCNPPKLT